MTIFYTPAARGLIITAAVFASLQVVQAQAPTPAVPTPAAIPTPAAANPALPGAPAAPAAVPGAADQQGLTPVQPFVTTPGAPVPPPLPGTAPGATALPAAGAAVPTPLTGDFGSAVGAIPTPPPLTAMSTQTEEMTTSTEGAVSETSSAVSSTVPVETYTFLFRQDDDLGLVREKFNEQASKDLKEKEINRLMEKNAQGQQNPLGGIGIPGEIGPNGAVPAYPGGQQTVNGIPVGGPGAVPGAAVPPPPPNPAARSTAEWDFYYEQLQMYSDYVTQKLIPNAEDLPELTYDATNFRQERNDLKTAYDEAAVALVNEQYSENKDFYETLNKREDRRNRYFQWIAEQQKKLSDWTAIWARKYNGTRWTDGNVIRRDDWYYGTNFNSVDPVAVEIDNRNFLLSKSPQDYLAPGQLNVISNNLTPYDIIDTNGNMKNPVMESMRGSLVSPPVETMAPTTGTIEMAPLGSQPAESE